MDILSITLAIAGCIGGLLIIWGVIALLIFRSASKRMEKMMTPTRFDLLRK